MDQNPQGTPACGAIASICGWEGIAISGRCGRRTFQSGACVRSHRPDRCPRKLLQRFGWILTFPQHSSRADHDALACGDGGTHCPTLPGAKRKNEPMQTADQTHKKVSRMDRSAPPARAFDSAGRRSAAGASLTRRSGRWLTRGGRGPYSLDSRQRENEEEREQEVIVREVEHEEAGKKWIYGPLGTCPHEHPRVETAFRSLPSDVRQAGYVAVLVSARRWFL